MRSWPSLECPVWKPWGKPRPALLSEIRNPFLLKSDGSGVVNNWKEKRAYLPGVRGGEVMLARSTAKPSVASNVSVRPHLPARPVNMGFIGVCRTSQLLGRPTALPEVESGGVHGEYMSSLR